jgi:hypothetical protein
MPQLDQDEAVRRYWCDVYLPAIIAVYGERARELVLDAASPYSRCFKREYVSGRADALAANITENGAAFQAAFALIPPRFQQEYGLLNGTHSKTED